MEACVIYLMYLISKILNQIAEYNVEIQGGSTYGCCSNGCNAAADWRCSEAPSSFSAAIPLL